MNKIHVLFFATLRDRAGTRAAEIEVEPGITIQQLKAQLVQRFPGLGASGLIEHCLASINHEYRFDETIIPENAEIAFFPPVSGGSMEPDTPPPTIFRITEDELDLTALLDAITLPTSGAAAIFTGMVRAVTARGEPHETLYLEYEAYKPMAEVKMQQVAQEIRQRWLDIQGIAIVQRVGHLLPRTPTVLIACTAAHRDTGVFDAARYGIDRLKEIVPVWKKEVGPGGEFWVEGDYIPRPGE